MLVTEPICFIGGLQMVSVKIYVYIFSLRPFHFSPPKSLVFFMGGLPWQQDLGKAGRSLETPMIHLQTSSQSPVSSCLFLLLLSWYAWVSNSFFFMTLENKASGSCLKLVGVCKSHFMGILSTTCNGEAHWRSVWSYTVVNQSCVMALGLSPFLCGTQSRSATFSGANWLASLWYLLYT